MRQLPSAFCRGTQYFQSLVQPSVVFWEFRIGVTTCESEKYVLAEASLERDANYPICLPEGGTM